MSWITLVLRKVQEFKHQVEHARKLNNEEHLLKNDSVDVSKRVYDTTRRKVSNLENVLKIVYKQY